MSNGTQLNIGILVHPFGSHPASWLHPEAVMGGEVSLAHYAAIARKAEQGLFDFLFIADAPSTRQGNIHAFKRWPFYMAQFEPITLLSALAGQTTRLGLAATVSTSFFEPYNLARQFASLDHLSGGRAAWNVVTSSSLAVCRNFGQDDLEEHSTRYRRAREFLGIVTGLWDSWDEDAFSRDAETATFFDPDKLHPLDHRGEFYTVAGPLNVPRPPQGYPVIIQAGGSDAGRELAAETAEVVFTADRTFEAARAFRTDLKNRMARYGRAPDQLKTVVSLSTVIGRTEAEAQEKFAFLQSRLHPDVGREIVSIDLGNIDLSDVPLDRPIPPELLPEDTNRGKTYLKSIKDLVTRGSPTLRDVYTHYAASRGGLMFVGTAAQAADLMTEWFKGGAADGFMLSLATLPAELNAFVDQVIPELQRRGVFRTAYEGDTLRENLGLPRPKSRYV
jgi:FMN-dependent oxidoreductase (nitrilotriacetate monooxygenase family)